MFGLLILAATLSVIDPSEMIGPPNLRLEATSDPAKLAAYEARRHPSPNTAEAHWKLGQWCEQNGLKPEAIVEYLAVTQLDPRRDAAWKKLGYVKKSGRWTTAAALAAEKAELDTQRKADAKWRPFLQKWKGFLSQKLKRAEAEAALSSVTDPRAVPAIVKIFVTRSAADQERAIDMLGRIKGIQAAQAIANLAVMGRTSGVRRAAVETLTRRGVDDVFMSWIGMLQAPIKYEIRRGLEPGARGELYIEGVQHKFRRKYEQPSLQIQDADVSMGISPTLNRLVLPLQFDSSPPGPPPGSRAVGSIGDITLYVYTWQWAPPPPPKKAPEVTHEYQVYERAMLQARVNRNYEINQTEQTNAAAEAQLQQDVLAVEAENGRIRESNARLVAALERTSGKSFGDDREAWLKWWVERKGYTYLPPNQPTKETVDVHVPVGVPSTPPPLLVPGASGGGGSGYCMVFEKDSPTKRATTGTCFAAGTPVQTVKGLRPIETLRADDQVLTAGPIGVELRPAKVASITRNRASRVLRLTINGDVIMTTDGHPFWKFGAGWVRAGELEIGAALKTRAGMAHVEAIAYDEGAEVWNFDVEGGSNYLIGGSGVIVHDLGPDSKESGHDE
jgi:hypothetical protein